MDSLDALATILLDKPATIYQTRAKLFEAALQISGNPDLSAQIAGQFSDIGRYLLDCTRALSACFSVSGSGQEMQFIIEFGFDDWTVDRNYSLVGGTLLQAARGPQGWTFAKTYGWASTRQRSYDRAGALRILTTKTRQELFDDINKKNHQLEIEIEERKLAEANVLQAQRDLIAKEKLAALGGLVAGIAHEINTPVGIGVTAASHLSESIREFLNLYQSGSMRRSDLEAFLQAAQESNGMVEENLQRASRLIRSFKEVAVDQTADDEREFVLRDYAEQVVTSLSPKLRNRPVSISLDDIDPTLYLKTAPGPMSQILTNLIMNSLIHGFDPEQAGQIRIAAKKTGGALTLTYADTGKGIARENLAKIFDPFFTTKRSHGGSGLGMHLVYNIVTKKYAGTIKCDSELQHGVTFTMSFPDMFNQRDPDH